MFAITGITGNVGGEAARNLLAAGRPVRAVMRDLRKGEVWAKLGCDVAGADINEAAALTAAFEGSEGVFVMVPPNFDPSPDFREARTIAVTLSSALDAARPDKVVYLSTIGAQATHSNLLSQHTMIERALSKVVAAHYFPAARMVHGELRLGRSLRPAKNGVISSFLQPLDKPVPMVATADIGRTAA